MITRNDILELKRAIEDYEKLVEDLNDLNVLWNGGDPSGDPSMQYCKETEIEESKIAIKTLIKELHGKITA